ncbi:Fatty acid hydroxylase FAH1P, putative [Euzebya pacifica]|uniref:Fatty acid hydroxylase FAH1P, putative n=1 Tax=Euzebya pacifica TaxID=1608957 RepID=A0A346Y3I8_9ACTN|nr:sterol desaturase family protein [Euzebya pacifica]AXV09035.1 Fatty acid hydroxylase FAH1P, putative [Euzebya pacifica]
MTTLEPTRPIARLRRWLHARRVEEARVEALASARVEADEDDLARRSRTTATTLTDAAGRFWRHPSPWIIATTMVVASVARVVVGGYHVTDLVVPLLMLASFPFVEWVIHVFVLHFKPFEVAGVTIDPLLAREHRAHHADPRDIPLVFIPPKVYWWLLPTLVGVSVFAFDRLGLGLTYLVALTAIGMVYEWVHYLIHSDYKPVTRPYRAVWRNHRLHHYKNENYWFTVTTSGTADRLLRTCPAAATVPTSPTARNLDAR